MDTELESLRLAIRQFADDRDWEQFHSPKNLASALIVEAGELLEVFQWLTDAQSRALTAAQQANATDELADVLIYLIRLADQLNVDLGAAARAKIARNAERYPVAISRGSSQKRNDD